MMVLFLVAILFLLGLFFRGRYSQKLLNQSEYDGRVVDKFADFRESQFGSVTQRRLMIEDKNGALHELFVNSDSYERAQIGMFIKNGNLEPALVEK